MKRLMLLLWAGLLCASCLNPIYGANDILKDDQVYRVVNVDSNGEIELVSQADNYDDAYSNFKKQKDSYDNLCIAKGTTYLMCEYGVVGFKSDETCSIVSEYTSADTNESGYTNGCYGGDGAFLDYNDQRQQIKFELSAVKGWIDVDKVNLYPYSLVPNVSQYKVSDGILYHYIKASATSDQFINILQLSKAPSSLKNDTIYYSYDTHYFYEKYEDMIDDKKQNVHDKATNASQPYYNYYQYISHRSTTNYNLDDLHQYLTNKKVLNSAMQSFVDEDNNNVHDIFSQSLLLQGESAFIQYQNMYGANAIMMLALAMNESNCGRSILAYERNNLFGHAAFDNAVEENASRYTSVGASIYAHAYHYISNSYLNPSAFQYHGGQFGNKAGGMNVQYASDPYWGEKASQYYFLFDQAMDNKDENSYALGITGAKNATIYKEANNDASKLQTISKGKEVSLILLDKITKNKETWYKVQYDGCDSTYSFIKQVGYIKANDLTYVMNEKAIKQKEYVKISFDANGGYYYPNQKQVSMEVEKDKLPVIENPIKEGYDFNGYSQEIAQASKATKYVAQYKKIKEIKIATPFKNEYELNEAIDTTNGELEIIYDDGDSKKVAITSDMVENFSSKKTGSYNINIRYGANRIKTKVTIKKNIETTSDNLIKEASEIIALYDGVSVDDEGKLKLSNFKEAYLKDESDCLSIDVIRGVDRIIQPNSDMRYSVIINDDNYDLQVSGLSLAIKNEKEWFHSYIPKTIKIQLDKVKDEEVINQYQKLADSVFYQLEDVITISGKNDFNDYNPINDVVYSLKKPENSENKLFMVIYLDDDGNAISLPTQQSESRILFKGKTGQYALCSINVNGIKGSFDFSEVNIQAGNGKDYIVLGIYLPIALAAVVLILLILTIILIIKHKRKKANNVKTRNRN